jgi:flavin reductase (DIM6/NTAB) family NADH-FMN oxidoreductase RutF
MKLYAADIKNLEQRYRTTLVNSLAGHKQVVLVGTVSGEGTSNLAIFNSVVHIGANPAYYGFICRPDTVKRDTLENILATQSYTFNYVRSEDFVKAHQTSARYAAHVSEFEAVGFTCEWKDNLTAPFVKEAVVKMALKLEDKIPIRLNNTLLIVGSIQYIEAEENIIGEDGFAALEKASVLTCAGLDAYYEPKFLGRLSYAKPEQWPAVISIKI